MPNLTTRPHVLSLAVVAVLAFATGVATQAPADRQATAAQQQEQVRAIAPPARPLPREADSAGVTKFSFVAYGDTRGRRDGTEIQYEHSLIVDSMLATIATRAGTDYPVKFILQSGDGVVSGRVAAQWNRSYVDLIDRLTTTGGVPYYLAPGNHDVTGATELDAPGRLIGLRNYLDANRNLLPPDGDPRRLDGYPTFALGYGNTFVIGFDSNIATDEKQFQWVKGQLEGLDRQRYRNVIAFFHHPPYSSGPHGGSSTEDYALAIRDRYMPLFRQHQVRMTIAGHEHLFEHYVERFVDASGGQHRMDNIVTGGGGAPIYTYQGEPDLREYLRAGRAQRVGVEHLVKPGVSADVIGVDWGRDFQPYRTNTVTLRDSGGGR
jgi:3',5'-cyclic AMP phosphodiesterase CpdA